MPLSILGQEVNLLLEDQLEELVEDNEATDWDEVVEELSRRYQQPLNINQATRQQLEEFPFLSDKQIEHILAYIYIHGQMQTIYELQLVEEMDRRTIELLVPFLTVETTPQEKHFPKMKNIVKSTTIVIAGARRQEALAVGT